MEPSPQPSTHHLGFVVIVISSLLVPPVSAQVPQEADFITEGSVQSSVRGLPQQGTTEWPP